ncbi:outer membrane beta-barrel protein [Anaeromyxobacter terrae]|uniref:outer membrane beta-barrel protein n=1 Tax=Anaeromyxobacter terrae TaxID=2925406 RepID=UPI001F59E8D7|nr:outer membrane beta-barrel protein [Anaeromyxobacter sp. SG22]
MRKLLALLIAFPLVAAAQEGPAPQPPSYPPRSPRYAPAQQRDGWYIGFGVGVGDGSVSGQGSSLSFKELNYDRDPTRLGLNFKVGWTVTPRLLLGLDITAARAQASGSGVTTAAQITNYDAVATFFPMERGLFLRGGLGLSALSLAYDDGIDDITDTYGGTNLLGGVGYAFWLGKQFNLTVNLDASKQFYGSSDTAPEGSSFWMLYAGFDWY